jgi:hypothetical protein
MDIQLWQRQKRLTNWWVILSNRDPRMEGFARIAAAIEDAEDLAWGSIVYDRENPDPNVPPTPSPLQLAAMLREAVARIEAWTQPDEA